MNTRVDMGKAGNTILLRFSGYVEHRSTKEVIADGRMVAGGENGPGKSGATGREKETRVVVWLEQPSLCHLCMHSHDVCNQLHLPHQPGGQ